MCRNITELRGLEPAATSVEIEAAARQYVRKVSGITKLSDANREPFERAVAEIAHITGHLLQDLPGPPPAADDGPRCDGPRSRPGSLRRLRPDGRLNRARHSVGGASRRMRSSPSRGVPRPSVLLVSSHRLPSGAGSTSRRRP